MTLLVFDLDGTITINNDVATEAFKKSVLKMFGISKYNENWYEYEYDSDCGIIQTIILSHQYREISREELHQFQELYLSNFEQLLTKEKGGVCATEGIQSFAQMVDGCNDVEMAIYTGGFNKVAQRKLDLIGIDKTLLLATASDGLSRKEIFDCCMLRAEKKYGRKFDQVILFGDSISDINIANIYGIPLVGITTQLSSEMFIEAGAKISIQNYSNISVKEIMKYVDC